MNVDLINEIRKFDIVEFIYVNFKKRKKKTIISCTIVCKSDYINICNDEYMEMINLISNFSKDLLNSNILFEYSIKSFDLFYNYLEDDYDDIISANILYTKNDYFKDIVHNFKTKRRVK